MNFEYLSGGITSDPTTTPILHQLHIFAGDSDRTLYHHWWDSG